MNNLTDITLEERYSALCGYTDEDIDTVFAPELPGLNRYLIRDWYNGYNWLGESVYNPFGWLVLLFDTGVFKAHWFETGTPTFLITLLQQRQVFTPDLSRIVASDTLLSTFEVDNIPVEALMFQAGYLTIADVWQAPGQMELTLKYPNLEVQSALNRSLLQSLTLPVSRLCSIPSTPALPTTGTARTRWQVAKATTLVIFYSYFAALGVDIRLEDPTNLGRIAKYCGV